MTNRKKKWKEYLWLNLSMAKGCYGGIIFSALASCLFLWLDIYVLVFFCFFIGVSNYGLSLKKLYSEMLYERPAYFYYSLPVSSAEIVTVKLIAGSLGILIAELIFGIMFRYLALGNDVFLWPWFFGEMDFIEGEELLIYLHHIIGALTFSGIFLIGYGFGNRWKEKSESGPKRIASLFCIGGLFCLQNFFVWLFSWLYDRSLQIYPGTFLLLMLLWNLIVLGLVTWGNYRMLEKRYAL